MGVISEIYARILRKFGKKSTSNTDRKRLSRSSSKEKTTRSSSCVCNSSCVVVRPRSDTEIKIERRKLTRSNTCPTHCSSTSRRVRSLSTGNTNNMEILIQKTSRPLLDSSDDPRCIPIVISTRSDHGPTHLNLVSTGSLLLPKYRSRSASIKQSSIKVART